MGVPRLPIVRRTERAWITMGRMFNVEVFNQTISGDGGTAPLFYTGQEQAAMLGRADSLLAQVTVEGPRSCQNIGSGCYSNRQKRCSYGNGTPPGDGCDVYVSCGPGNWDPPCPGSARCS